MAAHVNICRMLPYMTAHARVILSYRRMFKMPSVGPISVANVDLYPDTHLRNFGLMS